jgi:hypothetical protein
MWYRQAEDLTRTLNSDQIMELIWQGKNEPQIADELEIPINVVRFLRNNYHSDLMTLTQIQQEMREYREKNPHQYRLPMPRVPKTPRRRDPQRRWKHKVFHGTTVDKLNDIKASGLIPDVGDWIQESYATGFEQEEWEMLLEEEQDAVYLADWQNLDKAFGAMRAGIIRIKGGDTWHSNITPEDIEKYGLLVIITPTDSMYKRDEDGGYAYGWNEETRTWTGDKEYQPPYFAESNDVYTRSNVWNGIKVVTGKRLKKLYALFANINDDVRKTRQHFNPLT